MRPSSLSLSSNVSSSSPHARPSADFIQQIWVTCPEGNISTTQSSPNGGVQQRPTHRTTTKTDYHQETETSACPQLADRDLVRTMVTASLPPLLASYLASPHPKTHKLKINQVHRQACQHRSKLGGYEDPAQHGFLEQYQVSHIGMLTILHHASATTLPTRATNTTPPPPPPDLSDTDNRVHAASVPALMVPAGHHSRLEQGQHVAL